MKTIGSILLDKRNEKNLTMKELANKVGISDAYINAIEKNQKKTPPTDETLTKIAEALNMTKPEKNEILRIAALDRTPDSIKAEIKRLEEENESYKNTGEDKNASNEKEKNQCKSVNKTEFILTTEPESKTKMRITMSFTVNRRLIYSTLNKLMKTMVEFLVYPGGQMLIAFGEAFEHLKKTEEFTWDNDSEPSVFPNHR